MDISELSERERWELLEQLLKDGKGPRPRRPKKDGSTLRWKDLGLTRMQVPAEFSTFDFLPVFRYFHLSERGPRANLLILLLVMEEENEGCRYCCALCQADDALVASCLRIIAKLQHTALHAEI